MPDKSSSGLGPEVSACQAKFGALRATPSSATTLPTVFAVSRRFRVPLVERLVGQIVGPILERYGIPLTCTYAADDPNDPDHWVNRMGFIFDLADVHVVIDIARSENTFYEFEACNLANYSNGTSFVYWFLGIQCTQRIQPLRIIIHDQEGTYQSDSPSYYSDPLHTSRYGVSGSTLLVKYDPTDEGGFISKFRHAVDTILAAVDSLQKSASKNDDPEHSKDRRNWNNPVDGEALFPVQAYRQIRIAIARQISKGRTPIDLCRDIAEPNSPDRNVATKLGGNASAHCEVHKPAALIEHSRVVVRFGEISKQHRKLSSSSESARLLVSYAFCLRVSLVLYKNKWTLDAFDKMYAQAQSSSIMRVFTAVMAFGWSSIGRAKDM